MQGIIVVDDDDDGGGGSGGGVWLCAETDGEASRPVSVVVGARDSAAILQIGDT